MTPEQVLDKLEQCGLVQSVAVLRSLV